MNIENEYSDIFTEFDESVFSDGSLDPMGLRIIWTGLGNAIFQNRLNTISTDIRLYTLNLLHHYIIWHTKQKYADHFALLLGKEPYFNDSDLYDGIIIFLESQLTHAAFRINQNRDSQQQVYVPGIDKLASLKLKPDDHRVKYLTVARSAGILTRQYLLGIHGRHKGPFQQMGLLGKRNYYENDTVWYEIKDILLNKPPCNNFIQTMSNIVHTHVLKSENRSRGPISIEVDKVLTYEIVGTYEKLLAADNFKTDRLRKYWEEKLGFLKGPAALLYSELKKTISEKEKLTIIDYESIIKKTSEKGSKEDNQFIKAICVIEPLIATIDKIINRLLIRGTTLIDDSLKDFIKNHFKNCFMNPREINMCLEKGYLHNSAQNRLRKLSEIFFESLRNDDPKNLLYKLIAYHKRIMESRDNLPWLSIGNDGQITQHRSFLFSENYIQQLSNYTWVNDYYLSTVKSLYDGLYGR